MGLTPTHWTAQLDGVNASLKALLNAWLPRLQPVLERSVMPTPDATQGLIDGFDGITTRGSPERLLATEWALADAAPDLFLMRAAANEQLHHQLCRREEDNHQDILLIVDTSPSQAGAAQLVPLAIALVLMRSGNCRVWWTDTRVPGVHHPVSLDNVDSWLAMLTVKTATTVDPLVWQACADTAEGKTTVCIGQPPTNIGDQQVLVSERLTEPVLEVQIAGVRARLPLPTPFEAAQALRGERAFAGGTPVDGRSLNITLAGSARLRIYIWNSHLVRKVEPDIGSSILTMPSPGCRIVGVAERGGREWVLQYDGTGYSVGNPCLPSYNPGAKWRKGIPRHESARVHGVWRQRNRFVIQIDEQLFALTDNPVAERLTAARLGAVYNNPGSGLVVAPALPKRPIYAHIYDYGSTPRYHDSPHPDPPLRFANTWNGKVRVITSRGHYELARATTRYTLSPPKPGLLTFWKMQNGRLVSIVLSHKAGTLHVGTQLISAPKLIKAVAHPRRYVIIGITEGNALVRIDIDPQKSDASTIAHSMTVLVGRL